MHHCLQFKFECVALYSFPFVRLSCLVLKTAFHVSFSPEISLAFFWLLYLVDDSILFSNSKPLQCNDAKQNTYVLTRQTTFHKYDMYYKIEFNSVVRGHHVYKRCWTPIMGKTVLAKKTLEKRLLNIKNMRLVFSRNKKNSWLDMFQSICLS